MEPPASSTLAQVRRVGRNLAELDDRDRLAAAGRDPGEKIAEGLALGSELRRWRSGGGSTEPLGVELLRKWRALHG
jgi:hypothetical protein